jgi:hypothetical protein
MAATRGPETGVLTGSMREVADLYDAFLIDQWGGECTCVRSSSFRPKDETDTAPRWQ